MVQIPSKKAIFSYGTALCLWELSDRTPHRFDITIPQGAMIRLYDKERCICDLICDKDKVDIQIYTQAIKDSFILKGGLLISSMIGIGERVTMNMDTTVRGIQVEEDEIVKAVKEILVVEVGDAV